MNGKAGDKFPSQTVITNCWRNVLRLSSAIDDLVNSTSDQVGYIKGRRVLTLRLVDDKYY